MLSTRLPFVRLLPWQLNRRIRESFGSVKGFLLGCCGCGAIVVVFRELLGVLAFVFLPNLEVWASAFLVRKGFCRDGGEMTEEFGREGGEVLGDWLAREPFTLVMSSGFFGFFAHCGMLRALEEEGLTPSALAGSSAGALVAGCWAAGCSAQELEEELLSLERKDFWDPGVGFGLLKGKLFQERLERLLPVSTFVDCRASLAVSTFAVATRKTCVHREGPLVPAIQASCALPFLFRPVRVQGRLHLDGGILDRPGLTAIPEGQRTFFHHLASRSPWRRRNSPVLQVPLRENMTTFVIHGLPRVNPFRLERGAEAFRIARDATKIALSRDIAASQVHVHIEHPVPGKASSR